eukprot:9497205-Pyramimonas_sp.AAC.2
MQFVAGAEALALHASAFLGFNERVNWRQIPILALETAGSCISKVAALGVNLHLRLTRFPDPHSPFPGAV